MEMFPNNPSFGRKELLETIRDRQKTYGLSGLGDSLIVGSAIYFHCVEVTIKIEPAHEKSAPDKWSGLLIKVMSSSSVLDTTFVPFVGLLSSKQARLIAATGAPEGIGLHIYRDRVGKEDWYMERPEDLAPLFDLVDSVMVFWSRR